MPSLTVFIVLLKAGCGLPQLSTFLETVCNAYLLLNIMIAEEQGLKMIKKYYKVTEISKI